MKSPSISVIIPIYNGARWLQETLQSIFCQSLKDFEIILVNDASTDDLQSVLNEFNDIRLSVLHLIKNVGVANARNKGLAIAKGQYVAFCDADDICQPQRLEMQLNFLQKHPLVGICGSAFTRFDGDDLETVCNPESAVTIRRRLMSGNCFGMSTIMGRTDLLRQYGFEQEMAPSEDYDLWTRLASNGVEMANLPQSLVRYRVHAEQASRKKSAKLDHLARKIRAIYCARLLGCTELLERVHAEAIDLKELRAAKNSILKYCLLNSEVSHYDFRFLLAWLYQKLPAHGFLQWRCWTGIQRDLHLVIDPHYRFNIALIALLPSRIGDQYFDTLIKLKR
jgi:glycosyltransferase involved in cell wall biosynthesis